MKCFTAGGVCPCYPFGSMNLFSSKGLLTVLTSLSLAFLLPKFQEKHFILFFHSFKETFLKGSYDQIK